MSKKIFWRLTGLAVMGLLLISCSPRSTGIDDEQIADPVFSPSGGTYNAPVNVMISCATTGATIRYTTDGTEPNSNSYLYEGIIPISETTTLKARAYKSGWISSKTVSAQYDFTIIASPVFDPAGGIYHAPVLINISSQTAAAQIRYTLDGTEPNVGSALYTQPILVSTSATLKARAFLHGHIPSAVTADDYTLKLSDPAFSIDSGYYPTAQMVSISHPVQGAMIRYTIDGSNPTSTSHLYTHPLNIAYNTLLKAKAFKDDWVPSSIVSAYYIINLSDQMQLVQGGTFHNGTSNVTLSSYYIGRREITELEWTVVMFTHTEIESEKPVTEIRWAHAIEYCNKRSMVEGYAPCYTYAGFGVNPDNWPVGWDQPGADHTLISCNWNANGYRLPTEMEWMFAAQGGIQTNNYIYSGSNDAEIVAWHTGNTQEVQPVGTKKPNELGLFDMSGNLWEFCWDIYAYQYPVGDVTNPAGASTGLYRAFRGGGWNSDASNCTVARRFYISPYLATNFSGFRVARNAQ